MYEEPSNTEAASLAAEAAAGHPASNTVSAERPEIDPKNPNTPASDLAVEANGNAEADAATDPNPLESTGSLQTDAQNDVTQAVTQAREAAKAEVDAAAGAIAKLLSTAAGDVPALLTDAEAAAVPLVLSKVPTPLQSVVGGFVQGALAGSEATANALGQAEVAKGLAYAEAEILSVQRHLDALL